MTWRRTTGLTAQIQPSWCQASLPYHGSNYLTEFKADQARGPGIPPQWTPPHVLPQLKADSGPRFVDQNADRYPWSPLEPLVRAVLEMHPDFCFGEIDIITDRSPLRKLFAFATNESEGFQFCIQFIGKTALFVRTEKRTRDEIPLGDFQGYRQAFEDAYTKVASSAQGSTSHHRIVEYGFGEFRLLVRSAIDAYFKDFAKIPSQKIDAQDEEEDEVNSLVDPMRATVLDTAPPSVKTTPAPGLKIVRSGCNIPHAAGAELTTRAKYGRKPFFLSQKMPDLWISQTPHFIKAAYQHAGTNRARAQPHQARVAEFVEIEILSVKEELAKWTAENEKIVSRFLTVLRQVVDTARSLKAACLVSYKKDGDILFVRKVTDAMMPVLPEELHRKWPANHGETGDSQQLEQPFSSESHEKKA